MLMLFEIVANRQKQVEALKQARPTALLERSPYFEKPCLSLKAYLQNPEKTGIIAEFKRKSPSKGIINAEANVVETTTGYARGGASGLSVLTEPSYFMGNDGDLCMAREANQIPILRKDFTTDEYQIIEAKALGADVILLIAACLEKEQARHLAEVAQSLGLEVLFEIHEKEELDKLPNDSVIIGVNNRSLKTFVVDIQTSFEMASILSQDFVLVSESGLSQASDLASLRQAGYTGFLMGENFMKNANPAQAFQAFAESLRATKN
ncbi:MAG: indole-3-glycerol phosphate synthase TrpC [Bacteroidetes bacterium]|nr:MAG: indole-3-glycerol phosphate synthase TrpC [Bacteroidota bacterium]